MFFLKNHVEKVKIENIKSNEVYAPVEGEVIPLDEVDDAVSNWCRIHHMDFLHSHM